MRIPARVLTPRGVSSRLRRWKALLRPIPTTRPQTHDLGGSERVAPSVYWPTDKALELLHGPNRCRRCGGRGWVAVEDPLFDDGSLIDERCPDCVARKRKRRP